MRSQIKLGTVFGIRIGLHYSWFLIALLIVFSLSAQFQIRYPQWGDTTILSLALLTAFLFFVSLLLHELAHSVFARSAGLPVREITLFALGGVSQIEKNPTTAKTEFWMAFAGPLASVAIGAVCLFAAGLSGGVASDPWIAMLSWLGYINLALAAFNMVPGYPLDGGRILRAAIWWRTGDARGSTRVAAKIGEVVAVIFIVIGMFRFFRGAGLGGLWIAFIGWFLLQAARESYVQVDLTQALEGVQVKDVMMHDCPEVDGWMNLQNFVEQQLLHTGRRCFVVREKGEAAGLVTPAEVAKVDRARWPLTTLHDIMRPLQDVHAVAPGTPLKSALESMSGDNLSEIPVVSLGHLDGVLSRAQILSYLQTHAELHA